MNDFVEVDLSKVGHEKTSKNHVFLEACEVGIRPGVVPTKLVVVKKGKKFEFRLSGTKRDSEGEVEEWSYRHRNKNGVMYNITVFND